MLEHNLPQESVAQPVPHVEAEIPKPTLTPQTTGRIETYLDHIFAKLVKVMPEAERIQQRAEMGRHLEALVWAHMELDSTEEDACELALLQFGAVGKVARQWRTEAENSRPLSRFSARPAFTAALGAFAGAAMFSGIFIPLLSKWENDLHLVGGARSVIDWMQLGIFFGLPLITGLTIGRWKSRRQTLGTLYAQAFTLPLIPSLMMWTAGHFDPTVGMTRTSELVTWSVAYFFMLAPLGCLGAFTGSVLRRRRERKLLVSR